MMEIYQFFVGMGLLALMLMFAYIAYHIGRFYKNLANIDEVYVLTEIGLAKQEAKKLGIDIEVEKQLNRTLNSLPKPKMRKTTQQILHDKVKARLEGNDGVNKQTKR